MEQIANPISGCFVEYQVPDEEEENSDDDGDDLQFLEFKDFTDTRKGTSRVSSKKPKQLIGSLVDIVTRKPVNFRGNIHLPGQWWRVVALRTKKSRDKKHYPADMHALTYRLRDDERRFKDQVVHLLLTKIGQDLTTNKKERKKDNPSDNDQSLEQSVEEDSSRMDKKPIYFKGKEMFYNYLRERSQSDDLDIFNLEERLNEFYESFIEKTEDESEPVDNIEEPFLRKQGTHRFDCLNQTLNIKRKEGYELARDFKALVLESFDLRSIKLGQDYPGLVRYLPQLFPYQFIGLITIPDGAHKSLLAAIEDSPGLLAFKQIVTKEYGVDGIETSHQALERSGLLIKVPQVEREAILMYEYLKRKTKEEGHTGVKFDTIMDYFGCELGQIEEAHQFLEKHKVTKTRMEGGFRMVYLLSLWQAEKRIAKGISSLFTLQEAHPWKLDVNWDSENFTTIKEDTDQWRAAQLIANQPVVAVSGKGGCGKTHVVTQVITAARAASDDSSGKVKDAGCCMAEESDIVDDSDLIEYREPEQQKQPRSVKLLLTAPTGKAANLLGKRASRPSYTLHQVIFSHGLEKEWKHKDVNTLVVDECSLVAVATFSYLLHLLLKDAQLRRIVLLGDVRQLPSIEPGNFLEDVFQSLSRVGCGIELRNNHRAESQIVVDNATRISKKIYPLFVPEKFVLLKVPESNPFETGDDVVNDDTEIEVKKVLNLPALQDDSKSQFISFTRKICERINEQCCRKYSGHPTKTPRNRWDFRIKDKICCTKNGYVTLYEDNHGAMRAKEGKDISSKSKSHSLRDTNMDDTNTGLQQGDSDPRDEWAESGASNETGSSGNRNKPEKRRLCNGEIFFIQDVKIELLSDNEQKEFFNLSERDSEYPDAGFWVERKELKYQCKIRHAWARTIHTFQGSETDNIVYIVGKKSRHQNWQHVYTAITRGRKSVFIIGQESVLRQVIKTKETKRNTSLRKQLVELLQKNPDFMSSQSVLKQSLLLSPVHHPCQNHLDMTQGVTGILAALAEEHDGIEAKSYEIKPENQRPDTKDPKSEESRGVKVEYRSDDGKADSSIISNKEVLDNNAGNGNQGGSNKSRLKLKNKQEYRYRELDFTSTSPVHFLLKKIKENSSSPLNSRTTNNSGNLSHSDSDDSYVSENCDTSSVNEPRSNESIWSEADESQYVSFVDATMCAIDSGFSKAGNETCVNRSVSKPEKQDTCINNLSRSNLDSPLFTRLKPLLKTSLSGLKDHNDKIVDQNDSASSQWSDVPDESYLTLNLEDIINMENDYGNRIENSGSFNDRLLDIDDSNNFVHSFSRSRSDKNGILSIDDRDIDDNIASRHRPKYHNVPLQKNPEKQIKVKDNQPLPSVPDTPPGQRSRKRRSLETHDDIITSPAKQRTEEKDLSLTPLKRSLAELNFK